MIGRTAVRVRIAGVALLLGFLVLVFVMTRPVLAQGPTNTPQDIADWAQRTIDASSRAVDSANTILQLIQVLSIFIGALIGLAGLLGLRSVGELRQTRDQYLNEIQEMQDKSRAFEQRIEENLKAIREATEKQTNSMQVQSDMQMGQIREQSERSVQALTLLQLGKQQMDSGNIEAALDTFKQAFALEPQNRAINYFMGELYINKLDNIDSGISHLRTAGAEIEGGPDTFLAAKAAYAYALRRKGEQAPVSSPEQREYYLKSEWHFLEALKRNPRLLDIEGESFYGALGGLYKRQGRLRDAVECYEHALAAVRAVSSYPYNNLGILYILLREPDKAAHYFDRAIRVAGQRLDDRPFDAWARFDMVTAQIMRGNSQEVAKHLPMALQSSTDTTALSKFLGGLRELQNAGPSELLDNVIRAVQQNLDQRKRATQTGS